MTSAQSTLASQLPPHWTVVDISPYAPDHLVITRWEGIQKPKNIVIKNCHIKDHFTAIRTIIEQANAVIKRTPETTEDKKLWWRDRQALDTRLKESLICMEEECLGPHRAALLPAAVENASVILVLKRGLHHLPWESLPILRERRVTRMPTLESIHAHMQIQRPQLIKRKFYIVDPKDTVQTTNLFFKKYFTEQRNWEGLTETAPNEAHFKKALTDCDLFVWAGHSGGESYFPKARVIQEIQRISAVSLLMGCSTAQSPEGMVYTYVDKLSPHVVGTLWDVTDKDMNRYVNRLVELWIDPQKNNTQVHKQDLLTSATHARDACILKYLNGAATVVHGLPPR